LRQRPVRERGHDRADDRVGGQVGTCRGQVFARIGAEMQPKSSHRDRAHSRTLTAALPTGKGIPSLSRICKRRAKPNLDRTEGNRRRTSTS
jgi:hypothetical protein